MKDFKGLLGLENTFNTSLFSYTCDKPTVKENKNAPNAPNARDNEW